jgi:translation elongation factor EF-Ts
MLDRPPRRHGRIHAHLGADARTGVLVEVICETDFVETNHEFVAFVAEVARRLVANPADPAIEEDRARLSRAVGEHIQMRYARFEL